MKRKNFPERKDQRYTEAVWRNVGSLYATGRRFQIADMERIRMMLGIRTGDDRFDNEICKRLGRT